MSNSDTISYITTNLEAILTALGLNLESLPLDGILTTAMASLEYTGEEFEDNFQENARYNTSNFIIKIRAKSSTANADRDTIRTWIHAVNGAITVAAINVGDLLTTKLVTRINHDGITTGTEGEVVTIDYEVGIKYRAT